jgi:hypothetical protein
MTAELLAWLRFDALFGVDRRRPLKRSILSQSLAKAGFCKICGGDTVLFDVVDLNKLCSEIAPYAFGLAGQAVYYQKCISCDFIFTANFDDWDQSKFSDIIYNDDYIKVDGAYREVRPTETANRFAMTFPFAKKWRILDYGSGSGVFEAVLRENGYQSVVSYDPFSNPVRPREKFDIVTCIEVVEHSSDPAGLLDDIASFVAPAGVILFTTALQPVDIDIIRAGWWYIAPRNGHVSIYSYRSIELLAKRMGLLFFQDRGAFHAFAKSPDHQCVKATEQLPTFSRSIWAPSEAVDASQWHGVEKNDQCSFRWTAARRVSWPSDPTPHPCIFHIRIPFCGEIQPSFAARCKIEIGGNLLVPSVRRYNNLQALAVKATIQKTDDHISLITPEPIITSNPAKDGRKLGLAVAVNWMRE